LEFKKGGPEKTQYVNVYSSYVKGASTTHGGIPTVTRLLPRCLSMDT